MNVHTEFAIAAIAMAPLLAVSWAVTHQQQVEGPFDSATNMASARTSVPDNKGFDTQGVPVDPFNGTGTRSGFATSPQERAAAQALAPMSGTARFANNGTSVRH